MHAEQSRRTVLVTGANGFVGRSVCSELARRGCALRVAVRERSRAEALPGSVAVVGSLSDTTDWRLAVDGTDAVIHLAARVHVMRESASNPLEAFRAVNVRATEHLARTAAAHGVKRFVLVSSVKVNGETTKDKPFTPDDSPQPADPYAISKLEAERSVKSIGAHTGMTVTVVRPPLVYGPGVGGNFLRLLELVQRRVPLPFGAVDNRRSMVFSGNLADALAACAMDARAGDKTYLVSDGEDVSTRELVRILGESLGTGTRLLTISPRLLRVLGSLTGKAPEIERLTGSLVVDSSALRRDLAWSPPFRLREGLEHTARWFAGRAQEPSRRRL